MTLAERDPIEGATGPLATGNRLVRHAGADGSSGVSVGVADEALQARLRAEHELMPLQLQACRWRRRVDGHPAHRVHGALHVDVFTVTS